MLMNRALIIHIMFMICYPHGIHAHEHIEQKKSYVTFSNVVSAAALGCCAYVYWRTGKLYRLVKDTHELARAIEVRTIKIDTTLSSFYKEFKEALIRVERTQKNHTDRLSTIHDTVVDTRNTLHAFSMDTKIGMEKTNKDLRTLHDDLNKLPDIEKMIYEIHAATVKRR